MIPCQAFLSLTVSCKCNLIFSVENLFTFHFGKCSQLRFIFSFKSGVNTNLNKLSPDNAPLCKLSSAGFSGGTDPNERRIVLVWTTRVGKTATGKTILSREAFESERSPSYLMAKCQKAKGNVGQRKIAVIDTPVLFNTNCLHLDLMHSWWFFSWEDSPRRRKKALQ